MLDFTSLNWLAILVALLAHMILGAAWFGVFAAPWSAHAHPGKTKEEIQAGPKWIYGVAALGGLVTAIILFATLAGLGITGLVDALVTAFLLWLGFVAVKYATTYAFEYKSWTLWAIDVGYPLVTMLTIAAIYALWP